MQLMFFTASQVNAQRGGQPPLLAFEVVMQIYLTHPQHGQKVAIAEEEAIEDVKNGWERYTLNDVAQDAAPVNELKRRRKTE